MRTRLAALPLLLAVLLSAGCSGGDDTQVTEEGVVETPTSQPNGGAGLDARSGDPLATSDPSTVPSPQDDPTARPTP